MVSEYFVCIFGGIKSALTSSCDFSKKKQKPTLLYLSFACWKLRGVQAQWLHVKDSVKRLGLPGAWCVAVSSGTAESYSLPVALSPASTCQALGFSSLWKPAAVTNAWPVRRSASFPCKYLFIYILIYKTQRISTLCICCLSPHCCAAYFAVCWFPPCTCFYTKTTPGSCIMCILSAKWWDIRLP